MFIIKCLPFSKGLKKDSLSYFSSKSLEIGSLVKINIRNKSVNALVIGNANAIEIKSEIKKADFQLKKISALTAKPFLQKEFLEAVETTAEYFVANQGSVLSHLIPSFILENPNMLSLSKTPFLGQLSKGVFDNSKTKKEVAVLQVPDEERFIHYRSLIREEFAKNKSVFLCLPQNEDIKQAKKKLGRGIESFVYAFHNGLNKKELKKEWEEVFKTTHPVLIIGTAQWLFLPIENFGVIIIDKENKNGWKTLSKPFMDLRFFAETLANKKNIRAIIGDSFLRVETLNRYKKGEASEFESVKWRLPKEATIQVVDLKKYAKKEKEFKTLSPTILKLINNTVSKNSNIFIFAARKGLSSVTVCRDCGEQVKCFNCASPMILYKNNFSVGSSGIFRCHQCGETRDAAEVCQKCRSWRLEAFGAGIDRIATEIKKNIPNVNLFEIHRNATSTNIKVLKVIKKFYENKGSILLGTEMALPYLYKKVASSAIASFDSLFSIPDFRIGEKIFRLILQTRSIAKKNFLIQSHNPDDFVIQFAVNGNSLEFYRKEIADRKILGYPPFGIFIKITVRGNKKFISKETKNLENIFSKNYNVTIFPSIHEKKGTQVAINAVIKLTHSDWPNPNLVSLLKSLPPHFEIKVDPDNLL